MSSHHGSPSRLLADVGGTNARFAWQDGPGAPIRAVQVLPCADHASLLDAARHYLRSQGLGTPRQGAIGIANPITGDWVQMTNHHWSFSVEALRQDLGLQRLLLLNDFKALALSLPLLPPAALTQLGGAHNAPGCAKALIGPGTGLGVGALVPQGSRWVAIDSEGGHVSLAARTPREAALINALQARFGHASAERAVSGPGLSVMHDLLAQLDGVAQPPLGPAEITQAALAGEPRASETVHHFLAFLGTTAGNLALTLGARGGVYLGGGILPRLRPLLNNSPLRERFEHKGRFTPLLQSVPLWLIDLPESPALLGASQALDQAELD